MKRLYDEPKQGASRLPWLTAGATALAVSLWLVLGPAHWALVFDRSAISAGEWWRLLSGHWVHSDSNHALWDITALALIGSLLETAGRRRLVLAALTGSLGVSALLWWQMPELERYCGLSGLLNTLFVLALAELWGCGRRPVVLVAALVFAGKLLVELTTGQSVLINPLWPGVPEAHLAGVLGGLAFLAGERLLPLAASADSRLCSARK